MPASFTRRLTPTSALLLAALLPLAALRTAPGAGITLGPDGDEIQTAAEAREAKLLAPEFKDEAAGFRISPPANCRIIQRAGLDLFSFVQDNKQWVGSVQSVTYRDKDVPVEDYLKNTAQDMARTAKAVQVLDSKIIVVGPEKRPAGKLVVSFEADAIAWGKPKKEDVIAGAQRGTPIEQPASVTGRAFFLRQDCAVQTATNQFFVLTMMAPLAAKQEAVETFDAMIASFQVFNRDDIKNRRLAAIKAGRDWLTNRNPEELVKKLYSQPDIFRIRVDNKDVGYCRFDELESTYKDIKGLTFVASSRTFPEDGSIVMGENISFWAFTKQPNLDQIFRFSRWENTVNTITFVANHTPSHWSTELGTLQYEYPPADHRNIPDAPPPEGFFTLNVDRSVGNTMGLLSPESTPKPMQWRFPPKLDPRMAPPPPGAVEPLPLPRILEYIWPRFVDLTKPDQHFAFIVFNSPAAKLGLRTLSVIGPDTINVDGKSINAIRLLDEIDPGYTNLWVDNTGKILALRSSDNALLVSTSADEMKRLWAARLRKIPPEQDALAPVARPAR